MKFNERVQQLLNESTSKIIKKWFDRYNDDDPTYDMDVDVGDMVEGIMKDSNITDEKIYEKIYDLVTDKKYIEFVIDSMYGSSAPIKYDNKLIKNIEKILRGK